MKQEVKKQVLTNLPYFLIGYIGNPSKYYTVEGANLYMKMTHDGTPVDPLDYLNYEE